MMRLASIVLLACTCLTRAGAPIGISDTSWPNISTPVPLVTAWSAYSVSRKLYPSYAGPAFIVHNTVTTQHIGFVGSVVDTNALATFCGANSGYITVLYDQSSNDRHMTIVPVTVTDRLRVVNAGAFELDGNGYLHARSAYGSTTFAEDGSAGYAGATVSMYVVFNAFNHTPNDVLVSFASTATSHIRQSTSGGDKIGLYAGTSTILTAAYSLGTQYLAGGMATSGGNDFIELNNDGAVTGEAGSSIGGTAVVGYQAAAITAGYYFSEFWIFDVELSAADKTTLKNNINAFYTLW
jgi:hypothetical protein